MDGTRTVGVAVDFSKCSREALKWAVDDVVRNGDNLILITILPQVTMRRAQCSSGKPPAPVALIPLSEFSEPTVMKKYGVKPDSETLDIVNTAAREKEIVVTMKIYWGDAREKLCEAVDYIPLSCLVIGNRGLTQIKRAIMGSVSNYLVNHASCPVTVVKHANQESPRRPRTPRGPI